MGWRRCVVASFAVAAAVAALAAAPASAAQPRRAILVFYAASPEDVVVADPDDGGSHKDTMLGLLDRSPMLRAGLWSASQGSYDAQQVLLDVSQGGRQPPGLYSDVDEDGDGEPDALSLNVATRTFANWQPFRRRARAVSQTLRPGLLAGSVPGGAAFAATDRETGAAIVAADERGRIGALSIGAIGTLDTRVRKLLRSRRLVVVAVPAGATGRALLLALARQRDADELLLIAQLPRTPPPDDLVRPPRRYLLQPAFAIGDGRGGSPTSGSTRRDGLVSASDLAPTILRWLGLEAPDSMRGLPIEAGGEVGVADLDELRARWTQMRDGRQAASFVAVIALTAIVFLLLGTLRGVQAATRPALRIGALALLWWPSAVLLAAAVQPANRSTEVLLIAVVALALGALTERLLPWARAPIAPALVCLVAYTADLALGGPLLTVSALGPSVGTGSRFYGVSNELEPILPIVLLVGLAALMTGREITRRTLVLYAATGLALLVIVGWGRLGADVGGVLTVGAGVAAATLVMLPGPVSVRRLVVAALVPVAALALLIAIDLGLSGGSHLTRNLLRADDPAELWELVTRRYELAWRLLIDGGKAPLLLAALLAVAFAWRNRERLYRALPHRAWAAALIGGLAAGVIGALVNDSGPVLFINAVIALAGLTAYLLGRPDPAARTLSGQQ